MCGLFGATEPLSFDTVRRISAALSRRGPDAEGFYVDDQVTLVHRRLKIIELSDLGAQPMANDAGDVHVVFNGEIYNHHELRRNLERLGRRFRSRSDTEVIVHGYEVWGDDIVPRLRGMFAIGIWDRRRRRLLLCRDHAGKKPLFYAVSGDVLRFASTIEALHASGVERSVDETQIPQYLAYGFVPAPRTLVRGVRQLPPAGFLVWDFSGELRTGVFWQPRFDDSPRPRDLRRYAAAREMIRKTVISAVERRLEADVPLGAFLSGGIDSTIIVGVMAKLLGRRVRTFSIGFDRPEFDETSYARQAARAFDTDHTEFKVSAQSFGLIDRLVDECDGPFGDSSAIPTFIVSQLTRQHVTVALTGDGGDELFCGYQRFLAAEAAEVVPQPVRQLASTFANALSSGSSRSLAAKAARFLDACALPLSDRMARWNSFFPNPAAILTRDFRSSLSASDLVAPIRWQRDVFATCTGRAPLSRVLEHNFRTYLPFDLLVKADRCSMAHGLEVRSPFLDVDLIEHAQTLPPSMLRLPTKRILRDAFSDLLPPQIRRRGKMGFGVPLGAWFRRDLRETLRDHLGPNSRLSTLIDRNVIERLVTEHDQQVRDHGQRLWALLMLEIWLRKLAVLPHALRA
jgi:asparagine synthase (glutamine-hydrolysing)